MSPELHPSPGASGAHPNEAEAETMTIEVELNGAPRTLRFAAAERLSVVLRREGLLGVKVGCGEGTCGACTVLLDGRAVASCITFAAQAAGRAILTIEGLGALHAPHPLQRAFVRAGAVQCGYCTPGMLLAAKALLDREPEPSDEQIREALDGNLCRCTGYVKPLEAVREAARELREGSR